MKKNLVTVVLLFGYGLSWAHAQVRYLPASKDHPESIGIEQLDDRFVKYLNKQDQEGPGRVLAVYVEISKTPMLGKYRVEKDALQFEPRFPLVPGLNYRVEAKLPGDPRLRVFLKLPKPPSVATTTVEQVYPTSERLPENQLKFYLHFSAPMSRGEAYSRIRLLNAGGKEVERPFLELNEELWTPDGKRFTLFFHPGRVKRGLAPREELGPILEEGKKYTLVVDAGWPDENGNPLKMAFRKEFTAGKPADEQPDPAKWMLRAPAAGKAEALRVEFPKPLDHALLQRMIWIIDASGKRLEGAIRVSRAETIWEFTPAKPWIAGNYRLAIDTALEDLAGNSIAKPFEVDIFRPVQQIKTQIVEVRFKIPIQ